jgi:sugar porter (SP) family MFS transporter
MVGAPVAAIIADKLGRRKSMFIGGVIINLGMIIISTSHSFAQIVVGRFILGLGIAVMTVAAPAYAVEVAPPHWRGRCTGFYNCGWFGGSIPAALIVYGCNFITDDYGWRLPLIFQSFACLIVMVGVFFIPESPRWLIANGREDEALAFLVKFHGNGDPNSALVRLEIEEMRAGIRTDGIDKTWWDYSPFLLSHNGRWRLAQVLMISIFGQFSGNGLGYFNTVIFQGIGVTSVQQQLGYNILGQVLSCVGALSAMSLTDRMPRRKVLVIGTFVCALCLATNSGLSAVIDQHKTPDGGLDPDWLSYGQGALASYFLFGVIYSFTYTPLQGAIPTEALETTTRAKGLALSGFIVNAFGFINQFAGPIALGNIQYRYIFVFVGWDIIESILWYIFGYVASPSARAASFLCCFVLTIPQQCRVPGPYSRAARVGLQPAQPRQGLPPRRQGHPHRRWQGRREDRLLSATLGRGLASLGFGLDIPVVVQGLVGPRGARRTGHGTAAGSRRLLLCLAARFDSNISLFNLGVLPISWHALLSLHLASSPFCSGLPVLSPPC